MGPEAVSVVVVFLLISITLLNCRGLAVPATSFSS